MAESMSPEEVEAERARLIERIEYHLEKSQKLNADPWRARVIDQLRAKLAKLDVPPGMTADEFVDHLLNCGRRRNDALIVCDKGVDGDDVIAKMLASGEWELSPDVEYVGGKRIRNLRRVAVNG